MIYIDGQPYYPDIGGTTPVAINVANGTAYGLNGIDIGTRGGEINGSGILGML